MTPTLPVILRAAALVTGLPVATLLGKTRSKSIVQARIALYCAARRFGYSYPEIGRGLSRDHTTVLVGCRRAHMLCREDHHFDDTVQLISVQALELQERATAKLRKAPSGEWYSCSGDAGCV